MMCRGQKWLIRLKKVQRYIIIAMVIYRLREGGINYETQKSSCCDSCSSDGNVIRHDGMCKRLLQLKLFKRTDIRFVIININTGIIRTVHGTELKR